MTGRVDAATEQDDIGGRFGRCARATLRLLEGDGERAAGANVNGIASCDSPQLGRWGVVLGDHFKSRHCSVIPDSNRCFRLPHATNHITEVDRATN